MISEWEIINIKTICQCEELRSFYNRNLFSNLKKNMTDMIDNDDIILTVCLFFFRFRSSRERQIMMREWRICEKWRTIELRRRQREKKSKQRKEHEEKSLIFLIQQQRFLQVNCSSWNFWQKVLNLQTQND